MPRRAIDGMRKTRAAGRDPCPVPLTATFVSGAGLAATAFSRSRSLARVVDRSRLLERFFFRFVCSVYRHRGSVLSRLSVPSRTQHGIPKPSSGQHRAAPLVM